LSLSNPNMGGHLRVPNGFRDGVLWRELDKSGKPFTEIEAAYDLMHQAEKQDRVRDGVLLKRWDVLTTLGKLAENWRWSRSKVDNFLKRYANAIQTTSKQRYTILTLLFCYSSECDKGEQHTNNGRTTDEQQTTDDVTIREISSCDTPNNKKNNNKNKIHMNEKILEFFDITTRVWNESQNLKIKFDRRITRDCNMLKSILREAIIAGFDLHHITSSIRGVNSTKDDYYSKLRSTLDLVHFLSFDNFANLKKFGYLSIIPQQEEIVNNHKDCPKCKGTGLMIKVKMMGNMPYDVSVPCDYHEEKK